MGRLRVLRGRRQQRLTLAIEAAQRGIEEAGAEAVAQILRQPPGSGALQARERIAWGTVSSPAEPVPARPADGGAPSAVPSRVEPGLDPAWIAETVARALDEDLGPVPGRDVTTQATVPASASTAGSSS